MPGPNHDISAKDFRQPLLNVLGDLSGLTPGKEIPFDKTYDLVFKQMGISDPAAYGVNNNTLQTHRWIQFAYNALVEQGLAERKGRGLWALTQTGVDTVRTRATLPDDVPPVITAPPVPVDTVTVPPASPTVRVTVQSLNIGTGQPADYHPDPYIRGIATDIALTPCFGSYSGQGPTCAKCLAKGLCINATAAVFSGLAAKFAVEDAQARQAEERLAIQAARLKEQAAKAPAPPAPKPSTSAVSQPAPPLVSHFDPIKIDFSKSRHITIPTETVCNRCNKDIAKGSGAWWVRGSGIFHEGCYTAATSGKAP